jgi:hypothetical protein
MELRFNPFESFFVVFPAKATTAAFFAGHPAENFPEPVHVQTIERPWDVSFDPSMGAPAQVGFERLEDWTRRAESGIRHYSGIATYRTSFDLGTSNAPIDPSGVHLDLGEVQVMARVRVNGRDCGVVWTAPWRVDISRAVQRTDNTLEIEVANLWPNRMIGDAASPGREFTRTTFRPYKGSDSLLSSGLLGPVRIVKMSLSGE